MQRSCSSVACTPGSTAGAAVARAAPLSTKMHALPAAAAASHAAAAAATHLNREAAAAAGDDHLPLLPPLLQLDAQRLECTHHVTDVIAVLQGGWVKAHDARRGAACARMHQPSKLPEAREVGWPASQRCSRQQQTARALTSIRSTAARSDTKARAQAAAAACAATRDARLHAAVQHAHQQVLDERGALCQRGQQQDAVGQALGAGQLDGAADRLDWLDRQLLDCGACASVWCSRCSVRQWVLQGAWWCCEYGGQVIRWLSAGPMPPPPADSRQQPV